MPRRLRGNFVLINVERLIGTEGRTGSDKVWSKAQVIRLRVLMLAEIH